MAAKALGIDWQGPGFSFECLDKQCHCASSLHTVIAGSTSNPHFHINVINLCCTMCLTHLYICSQTFVCVCVTRVSCVALTHGSY